MEEKRVTQIIKGLQENIEKVIIGKSEVIKLLVASLLAQGHVLIEDVPGVGKTSLVSALAKSLDMSFKRIQFTPDVLPSDITGFSMFNIKTGSLEFHEGMIMSQIILADEINRTSPKTQSSLLEAMEEEQVTVDGTTYKTPLPFMVLATQNPVEYVGTFPLPEAQLDRFIMKIAIGYPTLYQESIMLKRYQDNKPIDEIEPVANPSEILELQQLVREVKISQAVREYISLIAERTRRDQYLSLGISPRGSISLMRAAQSWALINGIDYVLPDDIKRVTVPVMSHRMLMKPEARIKNVTMLDIIKIIFNQVHVPVIISDDDI